jgi:hypothetical protein
MHLDVSDDLDTSVPEPEALADVEETSCVAGCYRCLLSYYNQPDHESIDRRDAAARAVLVRLARIETTLVAAQEDEAPPAPEAEANPWESRWREAFAQQVPGAPQPLRSEVGGLVVLQWPDELIALALPETPREIADAWTEKGYDIVRFSADLTTWPVSFRKLARLLGVAGGTTA